MIHNVISGNVLSIKLGEPAFNNATGRKIKKGKNISANILKKLRKPKPMLAPSALNNDFFFITIRGTTKIKNVCITKLDEKEKNVGFNKEDLVKRNVFTLLSRIAKIDIIIPNIKKLKYFLKLSFNNAFVLKGMPRQTFLAMFTETPVKKTPKKT